MDFRVLVQPEMSVERYNPIFLTMISNTDLDTLARIERIPMRTKMDRERKEGSLLLVEPSSFGKRFLETVRIPKAKMPQEETSPCRDEQAAQHIANLDIRELNMPSLTTAELEENFASADETKRRIYTKLSDKLAHRIGERRDPNGPYRSGGGERRDGGRYVINVPERYALPVVEHFRERELMILEDYKERLRREKMERKHMEERAKLRRQGLTEEEKKLEDELEEHETGGTSCPVCKWSGGRILHLPCGHETHISCVIDDRGCSICETYIPDINELLRIETEKALSSTEEILEGVCRGDLLDMANNIKKLLEQHYGEATTEVLSFLHGSANELRYRAIRASLQC